MACEIIETQFDAAYAKETADRMIVTRGKDMAIARCNDSIAKGSRSPGGAAFWQMVLDRINRS